MLRITNNMMTDSFMRNYYKSAAKLDKLYNMLASGQKVSVPSDDPVSAARILKINTYLNELEQYGSNIENATSWMDSTESALKEAGDILQRIRELTEKAANGTNTDESSQAISEEVEQLRDQLITLANSTYQGRYIFGGTQTTTKPYDSDGTYNGNSGAIDYEISRGETITVNFSGDMVFGSDETTQPPTDFSTAPQYVNLFNDLNRLIDDIDNNRTDDLSGEQLESMDTWMDRLNQYRAEVGIKMNRMEFAQNRITDENLSYTALLSKIQDVDMAEGIMDLATQQSVYRAALATGARIIQPTLVDFLS